MTYGHERHVNALLGAIAAEKLPGDQVVLLDNHPNHKSADLADKHKAADLVIRSKNVGFAVGSNTAAAKIQNKVDLLMFLNPDTMPLPGAITKLRSGGKAEWAAWMGLLVLPDGQVNSAGNAVHISGLSWCDGNDQSASDFTKPSLVQVLTGADFVVRKEVWQEIGGFAPIYFLYYEDTDLSVRMLSQGHKLGLLPTAHVQHDYDFGKGSHKWFYIERNRYIFILRTWPVGVIVALLPVLLAMELALWPAAILQGRFASKFKAGWSLLALLPQTLRERRQVQQARTISAGQFLEILQPAADSPLLGIISKIKPISVLFTWYYQAVKIFFR